MNEAELKPEPWAFHLLGLITPLLAISGNILGVLAVSYTHLTLPTINWV